MPVTATTFSQSTTIPWGSGLLSSLPCSQRLEGVKEIFLQCAEAKKLWEENRESGNFTIECITSDEAPTGLAVDTASRTILISDEEKNTSVIAAHVLDGLTNFPQNEFVSLVCSTKCALSADGYADAMAGFAYNSIKKSHEIASDCVKKAAWPADWDQYRDEFQGAKSIANPDHFLERQEESLNSDFHRNKWYQACNPSQYSAWAAENLPKWQATQAEWLKSKNQHKKDL